MVHGCAKRVGWTPEYKTWCNMLSRCHTPANPMFRSYGARGIRVCERWHSYPNFLADMGPRPSRDYSIDRIDNDGNYEPSNCRWLDNRLQNRNKRDNVIVCVQGKSFSLMDLVERFGLSHTCVRTRLKRGWAPEDALCKRPLRVHPAGSREESDRALLLVKQWIASGCPEHEATNLVGGQ